MMFTKNFYHRHRTHIKDTQNERVNELYRALCTGSSFRIILYPLEDFQLRLYCLEHVLSLRALYLVIGNEKSYITQT